MYTTLSDVTISVIIPFECRFPKPRGYALFRETPALWTWSLHFRFNTRCNYTRQQNTISVVFSIRKLIKCITANTYGKCFNIRKQILNKSFMTRKGNKVVRYYFKFTLYPSRLKNSVKRTLSSTFAFKSGAHNLAISAFLARDGGNKRINICILSRNRAARSLYHHQLSGVIQIKRFNPDARVPPRQRWLFLDNCYIH